MENGLEVRVGPCPFKTARIQCLLRKDEKGSETSEQNFPCNHEGNYGECIIYKDYRKSQGK